LAVAPAGRSAASYTITRDTTRELRTGEYDLNFQSWLQPIVDAANQMNNIKRYAPTTAEVIPFPRTRKPG
jgi:hypothetical protein